MKILEPALALTLAVAACSSATRPTPTIAGQPTAATTLPTTTSTTVPPTTSKSQPLNDMALYRVDPATLEPVRGRGPLTTGDWNWVSGELSPNREWLVLQSWTGNSSNSQSLEVIETRSGEIVTERSGDVGELAGISDDGTVYTIGHVGYGGLALRKLARGWPGFKLVSSEFPSDFVGRGEKAIIDSRRFAWLGSFENGSHDRAAGIVTIDLATGLAMAHILDGVRFDEVGETDLGDRSVHETVQPAVAWDALRDRVLIVHGDEDKVTILDLTTGDTTTREWSPPTSLMDQLFAWLIPPARAKGPSSYGVVRNAVLDPSGEWLYVATSVSEVIFETEGGWIVEHVPQGVEAMSTTTWEVVHSWDIPVSEVTLSPGGEYLVATGTTWNESSASSQVSSKEGFVINTESHEVSGEFRQFHAWSEVQFAPDGKHLYIGAPHGVGRIEIVDLDTMEVVGTHRGTGQSKLFGRALLLVGAEP